MDTTTLIFVILATILALAQGFGDFTISWSYRRTVNGFVKRNIKIDFLKIALAVFGGIILFRTML